MGAAISQTLAIAIIHTSLLNIPLICFFPVIKIVCHLKLYIAGIHQATDIFVHFFLRSTYP